MYTFGHKLKHTFLFLATSHTYILQCLVIRQLKRHNHISTNTSVILFRMVCSVRSTYDICSLLLSYANVLTCSNKWSHSCYISVLLQCLSSDNNLVKFILVNNWHRYYGTPGVASVRASESKQNTRYLCQTPLYPFYITKYKISLVR